ncbi:MAG: hypothetical protein QM779_08175 [Propionicimonas sp.]|uniref:hypothetical protein n=1 Tax=Propionicimonas sp. TaxID=1955623 RepID=UPI003D13733E
MTSWVTIAAAAQLVAARAVESGKDWPAAAVEGVMRAAIDADGADLERVVVAGLRAAADPGAAAPAAIRQRRFRPAPDPATVAAGPRCVICSHPEITCRQNAEKVPPDARHTFTPRGSR